MGTELRRARLSVDIPPETRRRIRMAAAKHDQSIRDYVRAALETRLTEDLGDARAGGDLVALTEQADRVLADLWRNPKDSAYDDL